MTTQKPIKKKVKKNVTSWKISIYASYNNTIVTIAENNWNVISWATAWSSWFKWARKATPYAWQVAAQKAAEKATAIGFKEWRVYINWIWPWREQAVRWLIASWININWIIDMTPVPHNWCRKARVRKV